MISQKDKDKIGVKEVIGFITAVVPLIIQLVEKTCNNIVLKWIMAVLLTISLILVCISLFNKIKFKNWLFKMLSVLIVLLIYGFLAFFLFTKTCDQIPITVNPSADIIYGNDNIVDKSSKQIIDNSVHVDNRKIYKNYERKPRTIDNSDINQLKTLLPEKDEKIVVQYLKNNQQDTLLWQQVFNTLLSNGYSNVYKSEISILHTSLQRGKFTISKKMIDNQKQYIVIINPQE